MLDRWTERDEWQFLRVLSQADPVLAAIWWALVVLRGLLPALFAVAMGLLTGAVQRGDDLYAQLGLVGVVFVLLQVLTPLHKAVGQNLGSRTAGWLYDRLMVACVEPQGMGHLEDPELTNDLTMGRDFQHGMSGPPLFIAMDFIASGFVELIAGLTAAALLFGYTWWAPIVLAGAWLTTHWLLRESAIWRDRETDEVRAAQRLADYTFRLAVDPPAAKELRLFGLAGWTIHRFRQHREKLHDLRWQATRLRQKPVFWSLLLVLAANAFVFGSMAIAANQGALTMDRMVIFASAAITTSMIAFGGLSWALDGASAPAGAVLRLRRSMAAVGGLQEAERAPLPAGKAPVREVRFRDVGFAYQATDETVLDAFDLTIPAGSSLAIVGRNGAGKTTLAKLLCRLYDPQHGAIEVDGTDLHDLDLDSWRGNVTAVFQDFIRFELPLRDNVAPHGAPDDVIRAALERAGAGGLVDLDTILNKAYDGGTDLSGGQWQRVALARTLCAVAQGARLVLLDEPTAQLDVRGEAEIFDRVLEATRDVTTILISHRFSTVRHADRICVLEQGRVVELGSHEELMAADGRYRQMFDLQASRFDAAEDLDGFDVLD